MLPDMPRLQSYDGTQLAYHVRGSGPPLVCLPGGPALASAYLGNLGGLDADRTLILADQRGTGDSAVPDDPASYRCDRIVDDVEALRVHLGLDRMDLLAHSAGGSVAALYAARHPDRLARLVLVTPSLRAVGVPPVGAQEAMAARSGEWWYRRASEAWAAPTEGLGPAELAALRLASAPFFYGRWDERTRAHAEAEAEHRCEPAAAGFYAGFAPDADAVREGLKAVAAPVLILAGGLDPMPTPAAARLFAELFGRAEVAVQDGAGHSPWIDDPSRFRRVVRDFRAADAAPTTGPAPGR
jgi:pimeloyl-ACP methyl ester carboxylesterase